MIVKVKVVKDAVIVRPWQLEDLIGIGGAQIEGCVRGSYWDWWGTNRGVC